MRTSSSLRSSAASHSAAHTVNGRCCCNVIKLPQKLHWLSFNTVNGKCCCNTSQKLCLNSHTDGFNTVNGKHCCNSPTPLMLVLLLIGFNTVNGKHYFLITFVLPSLRSGTCNVWASSSLRSSAASHSAAHTVNGRCCCNYKYPIGSLAHLVLSFNTVNGKCWCNL